MRIALSCLCKAESHSDLVDFRYRCRMYVPDMVTCAIPVLPILCFLALFSNIFCASAYTRFHRRLVTSVRSSLIHLVFNA
jgi:hypothetical protein